LQTSYKSGVHMVPGFHDRFTSSSSCSSKVCKETSTGSDWYF